MQTRRLRAEQLRGICVCAIASMVALASAVAPARAEAAAPVLEYVAPGSAFPIDFTAEGGEVTAALDDPGFESVVHCTESEGGGEITGPHSTKSQYAFKGCKAVGGSHSDQECKSGATAEEIVSEEIEADLVYLDQAKHEVAMLLNPGGGTYMTFECGGEEVKALGSFLSPVDPINEMATSFEAILESFESQQFPSEYEGPNGETLEAIPTGEREGHEPMPTGVDLAFTIQPSTPLEIKAVSAEEVEVEQRQEEEAAAQKRQEEEAAARQRQAEEAAAAAARKRREEATAAKQRRLRALAAKRRQRARAKAKRRRVSARRLSKALKRCRKLDSKRRRIRCVRRARKKYSGHRGNKKHKAHRRHHSAVKSS